MSNIADAIADEIIDSQIQVLRAAEGLTNELLSMLRESHSRIMEILEDQNLTAFNANRLQRFKRQIERILNQFEKDGYRVHRAAITDIAKASAFKAANDLNEIFQVKLFEPVLGVRALAALVDERAVLGGYTLSEFWGRQGDDLVAKYLGVIRSGLVTGLSQTQMLRQLSAIPGEKYQIRTLVRTSTMQIANEARSEMYRSNDDLVEGIQWLSTLDARTSDICKGLDGLKWDKDYKPIGHNKRYPGHIAHPNCRSTQIPLIRSFASLATKNKDLAAKFDRLLSPTTRASMDGQVAESLNYEQWLRKKGDEFARSTLGATRFKLWSTGKLQLRDLLDQSSNPISVAELKRRFGTD